MKNLYQKHLNAKVDSERQKLEDYTSKYNAVKEKLAAM